MTKSYRKQAGFSVVEAVLVLVVVGALVFVGYMFMQKRADSTATVPTSSSQAKSEVASSDKELESALLLPNDDDAEANKAEMSATAQADGGYNEATN